jgi:hypothetical protein
VGGIGQRVYKLTRTERRLNLASIRPRAQALKSLSNWGRREDCGPQDL